MDEYQLNRRLDKAIGAIELSIKNAEQALQELHAARYSSTLIAEEEQAPVYLPKNTWLKLTFERRLKELKAYADSFGVVPENVRYEIIGLELSLEELSRKTDRT